MLLATFKAFGSQFFSKMAKQSKAIHWLKVCKDALFGAFPLLGSFLWQETDVKLSELKDCRAGNNHYRHSCNN